ncbi:MAG: DUF5684 domain-containing protein [Roseiflexaceae bacterium]
MSFEPLVELLTAYIAIVLALIAVGFLLWLLTAISRWVMFQKAGQAGWASLIPIYDTFVQLRIIQRPTWWGYLLVGLSLIQIVFTLMQDGSTDLADLYQTMSSIATIVAFIFSVRITHGLSRSFGHGVGFTLGLLFLPYIFYPILAFGSSTYRSAQ